MSDGKFRLLVTGSRSIDRRTIVMDAIIDCPWEPDVILHGGADGVDQHAHYWGCTWQNVETEEHPIPEWVWEKVGRKAGPMRNSYMVDHADAVVAVWDGESAGTLDTIQQAETAGLPVYRVVCDDDDGWVVGETELLEDDQSSLHDFEE